MVLLLVDSLMELVTYLLFPTLFRWLLDMTCVVMKLNMSGNYYLAVLGGGKFAHHVVISVI